MNEISWNRTECKLQVGKSSSFPTKLEMSDGLGLIWINQIELS